MMSCSDRLLAVALGTSITAASASLGALPTDYSFVGAPTLPAGAWDVGPDGKIVGIVGSNIVRQSVVNGATYAAIGSVPAGTVSSFGASFLSISPDGSTIALGDNGSTAAARVHLVPAAGLSTSAPTPTSSVVATNYAAAWASDSQLYVSGGLFGSDATLTRINVAPSLTAATVVNAIPDASGGVAIRMGQLFTGAGFGAQQGQIRSFSLSTLSGASSPSAFSSGSLVGSILSAGSLDFDASGNLIVAGAGGVTITNLAGSEITFAPLGAGAFYSAKYNRVTGQILVEGSDFFAGTSGTFAYSVPAPASIGVLAIAGLAALPRRRVR